VEAFEGNANKFGRDIGGENLRGRGLSGEECAEEASEGMNIGCGSELAGREEELFGGCPRRRSAARGSVVRDCIGVCMGRVLAEVSGDAEVGDTRNESIPIGAGGLIEENIGGFEIEVQDALLVNGVYGRGEGVEELCGGVMRREGVLKFLRESLAGDEFEDEDEPIWGFFGAVEANEVWVLHTSSDEDFGLPASAAFCEEGWVSRDEFEGDLSVGVQFECEPDDGGGTMSELFEELAAGEAIARGGFGGCLEEELRWEGLAATAGFELELVLAGGAMFDVCFEGFSEERIDGIEVE
jgi:hypothetical protein